MRARRAAQSGSFLLFFGLSFALISGFSVARAAEAGPVVSTVGQLPALAGQNADESHPIELEGTVLWAGSDGRIVLMDASGIEQLQLNLGTELYVGDTVRLSGEAILIRAGPSVRIGSVGPVVNNDGTHSAAEKHGAVFLKGGLQPIRLDWFNRAESSILECSWEGPGFSRKPLVADDLVPDQIAGAGSSTTGLSFQCYEGMWEALPEFDSMAPIRTGVVSQVSSDVVTRQEHAGVRFSGFVKVPRDGVYRFFLRSDDGSRLFVGQRTIQIVKTGRSELPVAARVSPGQTISESHRWTRVPGHVSFAAKRGSGLILHLQSGNGRMLVELARSTSLNPGDVLNRHIEATGVCQRAMTVDGEGIAGVLLVSSERHVRLLDAQEEVREFNGNSTNLPILTSAVEVQGLKREEAHRGYPVRLRGVITSVLPEHQAFTIQDSTRGLYVVDLSSSRPILPEVGDFLEVEGVTDPSLFAPVVNARSVVSIGKGHLPEPLRPSWDQLLNGSADGQYVEIRGIVTEAFTNRITLRTQGGTIQIELRLAGGSAASLATFENALVRIRGCLFAAWDYVTHQVKPGEVRIFDSDVTIEDSAPTDLFSIPTKTVPELRLFDPQAGVFKRVKVAGQLLFTRGKESFLVQRESGLRFLTRTPVSFAPGDLIEVAGFADVSGPVAPVLTEAVARRTGNAPLPQARALRSTELLRADCDATYVRMEGVLIDVRSFQGNQLLEMQSGVRSFLARWHGRAGDMPELKRGSRIELTGVYAAQPVNRVSGMDVASFELLLNHPAQIRVIARPPWWTLERLLIIVGALAAGLAVTALWITQLRRIVEQRTAELETQIQARERVEHQRKMEQERSRIAQDLHDELGSGITEIGMLASRASAAGAAEDRRASHLQQMSSKAREMVTSLDEIVWAMNPRHDSVASLISYFSLHADRFLSLANIRWRLDESAVAADQPVNSRTRHQLFLAFKEALTNVVRHSGATEVRFRIEVSEGFLRLTVSDNGRGLQSTARTEEMDGVENMRERMERLGGSFELANGTGTTLRFIVPIS